MTIVDAGDRAIYQTSTISALLAGVYDGTLTVSELLAHGDFGLGTFNHLDGEMVVLDGTCYQLHADGSVRIAAGSELTPYAAVTRFHANQVIEISRPTPLSEIAMIVGTTAPSDNVALAVRIDGSFSTMHTRTVGEQTAPYPPLVEATAGQAIHLMSNSNGTVAGFRTPRFESAIAVPGYHLHYIDAERARGGHVLDFVIESARISVMTVSELHVSFPDTPSYRAADMDIAGLAQQEHDAEG